MNVAFWSYLLQREQSAAYGENIYEVLIVMIHACLLPFVTVPFLATLSDKIGSFFSEKSKTSLKTRSK